MSGQRQRTRLLEGAMAEAAWQSEATLEQHIAEGRADPVRWAALNTEWITTTPPRTLEQHIAEGKRDAKRWAILNAEWEQR